MPRRGSRVSRRLSRKDYLPLWTFLVRPQGLGDLPHHAASRDARRHARGVSEHSLIRRWLSRIPRPLLQSNDRCLAHGEGSRLCDVRKRLGRPSGEGKYGLVFPVLRLSQLRTCLGRPQGFLAGDPPRHATREARWPARGIGRPGQQLGRGCCVCCCASTSPRCRCVVAKHRGAGRG
jgi:hypothetical protein